MNQDDTVYVWLETDSRGGTEWGVIRGVYPHYPVLPPPDPNVERSVLQLPFDRPTDLLAWPLKPTEPQAERETGA